MRRANLLLCLAAAAIFLTGCVSVNVAPAMGGAVGRGEPEVFTFSVGEITDIRVGIFCNIEYYSAPSGTVTLEIQPNLMDYVTVEETGGVLTVRSTRGLTWSGSDKTPVLRVSTPALSRLSISGAGRFTAHDPIDAETFTLTVSGAASGTAHLNTGSLTATLSGAGDFTLAGTADTADLTMSGAGSLDALSLLTKEASVRLSGVGVLRIHCTGHLIINASGVGSVEYKGSPTVDMSRGGLVTVKRVD
jgi:hypothetical protein